MARNNDSTGHAKAEGVVDHLQEKAAELTDNLRDVAHNVTDAATRNFKAGRDTAKRWEHDIESYIQEKPLKAILIASGVGFIVGMLWKRR